jgi:hypothetical protein
MVNYLESIFYETLEELNQTYKSGNSDILNLKTKYGENVKFSRVMHPVGHNPRYELMCCRIVE